MKKRFVLALLAGCLSLSSGAADFDIGISGSERGIDGFTLSIGNYYRVPVRDIIVIERSIPRDELGVVYLLAARSHRSPSFIVDLRLGGYSWWDITFRLGLDPHTLYVVDSRRYSEPPYGKAYGYYKEGKKYRLRDDEIVELSNVRFLSKYYGVSVDDVIDRRRAGEHYSKIDEHYRFNKADAKQRSVQRQNVSPKQRSQGQKQSPGGFADKGGKGPGEKGNKGHGNNK